jgi:outer membrane protein OmpA-like peptidoglycan-associated protein
LFDIGGTQSQILPDTDGDGIPDFQEVDSDNDGTNDIADTPEFDLDTDGDGMIDDPTDVDNDGVPDLVDGLAGQHGTGASNEHLETAVTGFGGSTTPFGVFMMTMLLAFRRFGGMKLLKRFLPMLLVAFFIVPSLMSSTAMADTHMSKKSIWIDQDVVETESVDCGTASVNENGFTPCNYVAGGLVMTHVDPEGEAGGFSTSDDMSNGFNLIVGRHFKPHWFGELSYTDMGDATLSNANPAISDETISYKVPSLHIGYLLRAPEKQLNFYVKGGVSAIQNTASSSTVPYEKQTNVQATFGLGAQWQSEKSGLFARLGADFFDRDAIALGLNVGYKFGGSKRKVRKVVKRAPVVPVYIPAPKPVVIAKPVVKPVVKIAKKPVVRKPIKKACKVGVLEGVNFHTNSAKLTTKAKGILNGVAHKLKSCRANKVTIVGHTDSVGSATKNLDLSQRRAASTRAYLVKQGVRANRMGSAGKGETQPRLDNKTKQGKAANRRVELLAQ